MMPAATTGNSGHDGATGHASTGNSGASGNRALSSAPNLALGDDMINLDLTPSSIEQSRS